MYNIAIIDIHRIVLQPIDKTCANFNIMIMEMLVMYTSSMFFSSFRIVDVTYKVNIYQNAKGKAKGLT
jgi:hypothetical protein